MSDNEEIKDADLADRRVIVRYVQKADPTPTDPAGHLAGEIYSVRNIGAALEVHPDAEIVSFDGGEPITHVQAKRRWKVAQNAKSVAHPDVEPADVPVRRAPVVQADEGSTAKVATVKEG